MPAGQRDAAGMGMDVNLVEKPSGGKLAGQIVEQIIGETALDVEVEDATPPRATVCRNRRVEDSNATTADEVALKGGDVELTTPTQAARRLRQVDRAARRRVDAASVRNQHDLPARSVSDLVAEDLRVTRGRDQAGVTQQDVSSASGSVQRYRPGHGLHRCMVELDIRRIDRKISAELRRWRRRTTGTAQQ